MSPDMARDEINESVNKLAEYSSATITAAAGAAMSKPHFGLQRPQTFTPKEWVELNNILHQGQAFNPIKDEVIERSVSFIAKKFPPKMPPGIDPEQMKDLIRQTIRFGDFYVPPMHDRFVIGRYIKSTILTTSQEFFYVGSKLSQFCGDPHIWKAVKDQIKENKDASFYFISGKESSRQLNGLKNVLKVFADFLEDRSRDPQLRRQVNFFIMEDAIPYLHFLTSDHNAAILELVHKMDNQLRVMVAFCSSNTTNFARYSDHLRQRAEFAIAMPWVKRLTSINDLIADEKKIQKMKQARDRKEYLDPVPLGPILESETIEFMKKFQDWTASTMDKDLAESWEDKLRRWLKEQPDRERYLEPAESERNEASPPRLAEEEYPPDLMER